MSYRSTTPTVPREFFPFLFQYHTNTQYLSHKFSQQCRIILLRCGNIISKLTSIEFFQSKCVQGKVYLVFRFVFLDFLIFTYLWLKAMYLELSLQYRRCSRLRSSSYSSLLLASLNRPSMIRSLSRQWDLAPMYCPGVFGRGPLKQSSIFHTTYSYTKFSKFPGRILLCFLIHKMKSNLLRLQKCTA